jgi:catechol 2,3-dioxygenase-like lactoylglutathione lyase family enzyme
MSAKAVHFLHLNLNTTDAAAAKSFYTDVFSLKGRMQGGSDDGDWRFHGLEEPVSSEAEFFYDERGPRTSPGLEVIQWKRPATGGSAYPQFAHRGMTSVQYAVPSLDAIAVEIERAGGSIVGKLGDNGLLAQDLDGVRLELNPQTDPEATKPRVAGARIGCADLDASLDWYGFLGFEPDGSPQEQVLDVAGQQVRFRSARVALPAKSIAFELTQFLDPIATEPAQPNLWFRGMVRCAISVENLDDTIDYIKSAGRPSPEPQEFAMPAPIDSLRVLFLTDPDGFTVELVHRPSSRFGQQGGRAQ